MDKVKLGFIGVGGIAGAHLNILAKMDDVELTTMCDINPDTLSKRCETYNVSSSYTNFKEMLEKEDLDAAYVCVPPFAHSDIEEEVALLVK